MRSRRPARLEERMKSRRAFAPNRKWVVEVVQTENTDSNAHLGTRGRDQCTERRLACALSSRKPDEVRPPISPLLGEKRGDLSIVLGRRRIEKSDSIPEGRRHFTAGQLGNFQEPALDPDGPRSKGSSRFRIASFSLPAPIPVCSMNSLKLA